MSGFILTKNHYGGRIGFIAYILSPRIDSFFLRRHGLAYAGWLLAFAFL